MQFVCNQIVLTLLFFSTFFKNNVKLNGILIKVWRRGKVEI